MVGTQFHPEFNSRPWEDGVSPVYAAFLKKAIEYKNKKEKD
jgi:CTP synthase (UTP-ammonia lyase)